MANIKISELNELYNAQKDYGDYVPIVDTSANETKKISVQNLIPSNVEIIAVTDTEPSEYETGDKYYNTTNNRIYTATSSGWVSPQEPIKGILYIILEEQKSYTYDGTTLISVGGGGGGGIAVYPDEPEEDTKLYIESADLDGQYDTPEDIYSTSEIKTNKTWIDGKPIYRKVFTGTLGTTGSNDISFSIDYLIDEGGYVRYSTAYQFPIPSTFGTQGTNDIRLIKKDTNTLTLQYGSNLNNQDYAVWVEYTKTS